MLKVLTLNDNTKWDEIVKTFKNYDVYYLSGYAKGFYLHGDGEPLLFYFEDENIRAINVVMKRDISNDVHFSSLEKNKYYDFATPYGYGGWIIEGNGSIDSLINEYRSWCINNSIISEVIRFHPMLNNQENVNKMYDVVYIGNTVYIGLESEDDIWNNITSKNRNIIRKAIKNDVVIKRGLSKDLLLTFKDIYNKTMDRDSADQYYYFEDIFYDSIFNDLTNCSDVFYAEYDNKIIAASIILKTNNLLNYHLSGSLVEYRTLAPTNLLLYEVAKYGFKEGYKTLHLGGGVGSREDRLYAFKKAFNKKEDKTYCIGKLIFDEIKYNELVTLRGNNNLRENYFPLYRA